MNRWELLTGPGTLVSMFAGIFVSIVIVFIGSGKQWRAAQARAREHRIADARMNARLLRLNI